MSNLFPLVRKTPEKPYSPGKMQFELNCLPADDYRIDAAFIVIRGGLNIPAAGLTSDQQTRLIQLVECERRLRFDGIGGSVLDWAQAGKDSQRPAQLAPGADVAVHLAWPLNIGRDERFIEPADSAPATAFYAGKMLDVHMAKVSDILAGLAVNAGAQVYVEFHLSPLSDGTVPASCIVNYVDFTAKETILPAGDLVDCVIVKNDGSAITDAELGNMRLNADAKVDLVESNTRLATLVRRFNRFIAKGAQVQGATDGVEGESMDLDSVPFVAVWTPMPPAKGTQLPRAEKKFTLYNDGTLATGSARVYYRMREVQDELTRFRGAKKVYGSRVTADSFMEAKTASKNGVHESRGFLSGIAARVRNLRPKA